MAEIIINANDIEKIIETYKNDNETFVIKSCIKQKNKLIYKFYLNGKECCIDLYIKKDNKVNILPNGKNIETSNLLIDYIIQKGFNAKTPVKQFAFDCNKNIVNALIAYITNECKGIIEIEQSMNIYKFKGYNGDILTFTFYPSKNRAMIQGKPFQVFSIIITYLSELAEFTFEDIVKIGNTFVGGNTSSDLIRNEMEAYLGHDAYLYLDEALLKSISGSLSILKNIGIVEDYTGCLTGVFKALEGYLKKLLTKKFSYQLGKKDTFNMFYKTDGKCEIEKNERITANEKHELLKLYSHYSNKRNVYLHATVEPSQTRIIETLDEAKNLIEEILLDIKNSYKVFFN